MIYATYTNTYMIYATVLTLTARSRNIYFSTHFIDTTHSAVHIIQGTHTLTISLFISHSTDCFAQIFDFSRAADRQLRGEWTAKDVVYSKTLCRPSVVHLHGCQQGWSDRDMVVSLWWKNLCQIYALNERQETRMHAMSSMAHRPPYTGSI